MTELNTSIRNWYVKKDIVSFFHLHGLHSTAGTFRDLLGDHGLVSPDQVEDFLQQRFSFDQVDELLMKVAAKCVCYQSADVEETI